MKVKWKEYEISLISIITAITLSNYVWNMSSLTSEKMETDYINDHISKIDKRSVWFTTLELPIGAAYFHQIEKIIK